MSLIDNKRVVLAQVPVPLHFGEEDSVRHQLDAAIGTDPVCEANLEAHAVTDVLLELRGNTLRHSSRRQPPRLGMTNPASAAATQFKADFWQLRGLAGARFAGDDDHLVCGYGARNFLAPLRHRQVGRVLNFNRQFSPVHT